MWKNNNHLDSSNKLEVTVLYAYAGLFLASAEDFSLQQIILENSTTKNYIFLLQQKTNHEKVWNYRVVIVIKLI